MGLNKICFQVLSDSYVLIVYPINFLTTLKSRNMPAFSPTTFQITSTDRQLNHLGQKIKTQPDRGF